MMNDDDIDIEKRSGFKNNKNLRFRKGIDLGLDGGSDMSGKYVLLEDPCSIYDDENFERSEHFDPASQLHTAAASDEKSSFFQVGRDFESYNVTHKFTRAERRHMTKYESLDYTKSHCKVFKEHMAKHPGYRDLLKWAVFFIVGLSVGIVAFCMTQSIDLVFHLRREYMIKILRGTIHSWPMFRYLISWMFYLGTALFLVIISSCLVVLYQPPASGSGVPEVMGYLNGVHLPQVFSLRTIIVKFVSCVCAVSSGLPVGPEGPMIHLGAALGAGIPQGEFRKFNLHVRSLDRFRNPVDHRDFITGGAAAGVSAAFGAPVGGLLFVMEEVASFWFPKLTWMIFFGCMVATFARDIFNSSFHNWKYIGNFGFFVDEASILFGIDKVIRLNVLAIIPTFVVGAIGGILGAVFTFFNLKITRLRVRSVFPNKLRRIVEPLLIVMVFASLGFFLPVLFQCKDIIEPEGQTYWHTGEYTVQHTCPDGQYNPLATLFLRPGDASIKELFSRGTGHEFSFGVLFVFLLIYFVFACITAGTSICSGLVVPMLLIGATYGRIVGLILIDLFPSSTWIDPGVFALIGAGSFFGGVSRLTISLTVIILEISNDLHYLLPIMLGIMISKWIADFTTHSLYHGLLEVKCVPFLDYQPIVKKLECFSARDVMKKNVICFDNIVNVSHLKKVLESNRHNGFPVTTSSNLKPGTLVYQGLILRSQIICLLRDRRTFFKSSPEEAVVLPYDVIHESERQVLEEGTKTPELDESDEKYSIDLGPYVNTSVMSIQESFSLDITFRLFRSMGLRYLVVVTEDNTIVGIITRKDLLGQSMEEAIHRASMHGASLETFAGT